jgi:hypothetical protein
VTYTDSMTVTVTTLPPGKLSGAIIGSPGSWSNSGNTITNVFDGNLITFYDAVNASGDWAGLDLGVVKVITQVRYCPRSTFASRMVGGVFQGANTANFTGAVTLFTVTTTPTDGTLTSQSISDTNAYRYVRYLGPNSGNCNVAELEFYGHDPQSDFALWQFQYFGCTNCANADPNADPFGKGISNTNQFLLGLNPTNSASTFRILSVVPQGSGVIVTWQTAGGRTNVLQATDGDTSGNYSNNFVDIPGSLTVISGSGDAMTNYTDVSGATNNPMRFYRIRLGP